MSKEYTASGEYIINKKIIENFSSYSNIPDDINTLSTMSETEIIKIIDKLSIIQTASLLSMMVDDNNINKVSQILLLIPLEKVYSIIPTMIISPANVTISNIVLILLNMPISTIALIISNMSIPQNIYFPDTNNKSSIINIQKAVILSNPTMPTEKAALILSDDNISTCQAALILSSMNKDISLLIL